MALSRPYRSRVELVAHYITGYNGFNCCHRGGFTTRPDGTSDPNCDCRKEALELLSLLDAFVDGQKPLGKDFEQVWDDNIESLYED